MKNREKEMDPAKRVLFRIGLLFLILSIAGFRTDLCQAQSSKETVLTEKVMIADGSSMSSAPLYVALQKGFFKQESLEVECQGFSSGKTALEMVRQGKANLATAADLPIMYAIMEGAGVSVITSLSEDPQGCALIARKDKGISTEADLKGKTIGVPMGTSAEFFLDDFLTFNKIAEQDVRIVNILPERMETALKNYIIDAAAAWNPYIMMFQETLGDKTNVFYGKSTYKMMWNVAGMESFVKENPKLIQKFLRGLIAGAAFVKEHPAESRKITAGFLKMSEAQIAAAWCACTFQVALQPLLLMNLEDQARWAIRKNPETKQAVPNFLDHFYFEGLNSVAPGAVSIIH